MGWHHVYLFKCEWLDIFYSKLGIHVNKHLTSVNMSRTCRKGNPFVSSQEFYLKNCKFLGDWYVVQKVINRNVYDLPQVPSLE